MSKILIIEDEKMLSEMYQDKFVKEDFKVEAAKTAEEGLEMLRREKPDLVLLDILLPKGNGIYFLEQMNEDTELKNIKVIAFSNYNDKETKYRAKELGVEDYLIKTSYTPDQIVKEVKKHLNN